MLTREQYDETKGRIDAFEQWRGNRICIDPNEIPEGLDVTDAERSAVEVYEFMTNPPMRYFLYISVEGDGRGKATTWTGELLGTVSFGIGFRSTFGDTRVPVRILAINGRKYAGTYYKSAGDYARVKMCKG